MHKEVAVACAPIRSIRIVLVRRPGVLSFLGLDVESLSSLVLSLNLVTKMNTVAADPPSHAVFRKRTHCVAACRCQTKHPCLCPENCSFFASSGDVSPTRRSPVQNTAGVSNDRYFWLREQRGNARAAWQEESPNRLRNTLHNATPKVSKTATKTTIFQSSQSSSCFEPPARSLARSRLQRCAEVQLELLMTPGPWISANGSGRSKEGPRGRAQCPLRLIG